MRLFTTACLIALSSNVFAGSLNNRVELLEQRLSGDTYIKQWQTIEQLRDEMRALRGEIEQQEYTLQSIQDKQQQLYLDIDQRLLALEQFKQNAVNINSNTVLENENEPESSLAEPEHQPPATSFTEEQLQAQEDLYQKALQTLRDGHYNEASAQFKQLIQTNPQGEFADNAQYWIGESHYIQRQFVDAKSAFEQVLNNYPHSNKTPDTLLKIGFILLETNDTELGRKQLLELQQQYPTSSAAKLAAQRLSKKP